MKYVIYNKETKSYLKCDSENKYAIKWSKKLWDCSTYSSIKAANNIIKQKTDLTNIGEKLIIRYDSGKDLEPLTLEEAGKKVDAFIDAFKVLYSDLPHVQAFYNDRLAILDGMQEDLLHKIEFDSVQGVQGIRLVKQLKEVRLERREVKDKLALIKVMTDKNFNTLGSTTINYLRSVEQRTYTPRQLPELFN